ncbi:hypothetical protein C474_12511 [Halogeometricum pallidum JCM 14848]|uniref:DUF192 domain-containing protein n=1 Tax=Halogeometricum pallidum JCM 14848 TaxID=1227487 RepID=M0D590_HALPD|nr:DUF192 domain-containing protein [Halogeometricum pallidum]ELZ29857.1 hypothetical protein C474_12511 [Halogeometricum pallidum JCM 14848]
MVDSRYSLGSVLLAALVLVSVGALVVASNPTLLPGGDYNRTSVSIVSEGEVVTKVDVRVADSYEKRYTGLSDTESLGADEGMLFVHDEEGEYAYVMREMAFPLDIVFVDANGTITRIHHAELPSEGASGDDLTRYRGTGKYVLEVPYGYTNETGVDVGDTVRIDDY